MICPLVASIPIPTFIHILAKPLHVLFKYFKLEWVNDFDVQGDSKKVVLG